MMLPFLPHEAKGSFSQYPALIGKDFSLSFEELAHSVQRFSLWLQENHPSERVLFEAHSTVESVVLFWAALNSGRVAVPLNYRLPDAGLKDTLRFLNASVYFGKLPRTVTKGIHISEVFSSLSGQENPGTLRAATDEFHPATLVFTSGSTARPRAVLHSYGNHYYSALGANRNMPLQIGDRWLLSLPLYHVAGIAILFRTMLTGAAVILPDEERSLKQNILQSRPTHLSLVAAQLNDLLEDPSMDEPIREMKAILMGGSAIPENLLRKAYERGWPLVLSYGSTQMSSQITATAPGDSFAAWQTSGRVLAYREVRIDDSGEIWVRGKTLFLGYWENGAVQKPTDDQGWFASGDLGLWDEEKRLVVLGRKDRMFISGGENIFPEEIERALEKIPAVERAVVVPIPEARFGHRPVAFVKAENFDLAQEVAFKNTLRQTLPGYKIPLRIFAWPDDVPSGMKVSLKWFENKARMLLKENE